MLVGVKRRRKRSLKAKRVDLYGQSAFVIHGKKNFCGLPGRKPQQQQQRAVARKYDREECTKRGEQSKVSQAGFELEMLSRDLARKSAETQKSGVN